MSATSPVRGLGRAHRFAGGSHATLINSIKEKLAGRSATMSAFVCGHGAGSSIGQERMTNPFLTGEM